MTVTSGILAALAAPLAMTLGFVIWDNFWKGSAFALNMYKCTLASFGFLLLSVVTRVVRNEDLFPSDAFTTQNIGFLMLSSTIGILVGDWTWLEGLRLIGATRVIVVDTCKPFLAALIGWTILGESLPPGAFGGMALTVVGVLVVSLEKEQGNQPANDNGADYSKGVEDESNSAVRTIQSFEDSSRNVPTTENDSCASVVSKTDDSKNKAERPPPTLASKPLSKEEDQNLDRQEEDTQEASPKRRFRVGYSMAFLNVILDTFGSLLTKEYGVDMTTWEINLIRFGFAGASMLSLSAILRLSSHYFSKKSDKPDRTEPNDQGESGNKWYLLPTMNRRNWLQVSVGVLFVTFLCPALSNYALFQIALALALTLGSVGPLYALPLAWMIQKERPSWRSMLGALLAVGGVVVLSLLGTKET